MKNIFHACIIGNQEGSKSIALLLKKEFPGSEINFYTENFQPASVYRDKNPEDLLFADIPADDETVFEIVLKLRQKYPFIIFMTDSENPTSPVLKKEVAGRMMAPDAERKITDFRDSKASFCPLPQSKINLPTLQGFKRVNINEIIRCEADSNYTFIYLLDKTKVVVSKTLHDFEKNLSNYNFFRIHHKHLINLEHLKEYIKGKGGQVVMADNSVLDVSTRRKNDFLHKMI